MIAVAVVKMLLQGLFDSFTYCNSIIYTLRNKKALYVCSSFSIFNWASRCKLKIIKASLKETVETIKTVPPLRLSITDYM